MTVHWPPPEGLCHVETPLGAFTVRQDDDMRIYLAEPGGYEPEVMRIIHALPERRPSEGPGGLSEGPLRTANIGANIGYFGRALWEHTSEPPWLVEPVNANAILLYENVPQAQDRIIRCAASDYDGTGLLACHPTNGGDNRLQPDGDTPCHVRRMDRLLPEVDFAIVDCQGHDAVVMAGWAGRPPTVVIVEHAPQLIRWAGGRNPQEDLNLYRRLRYTATPLQHPNPERPDVNLLLVQTDAPAWAQQLRDHTTRTPAAAGDSPPAHGYGIGTDHPGLPAGAA